RRAPRRQPRALCRPRGLRRRHRRRAGRGHDRHRGPRRQLSRPRPVGRRPRRRHARRRHLRARRGARAEGGVIADRLPRHVTIYEVGPRDGLQNESRMVPTPDKIAFIDALSESGLPYIEITSFVNPKWIPQLADAAEVSRGIRRRPGVVYSALVPNKQGLDAALGAGMTEIAVFLSASETHNKKNINKTIAETLRAFEEVVAPARAHGARVRAYVSTVYGCPYEGEVDPKRAVELCVTLRQMGVYQVSLGDTIGVANPAQVERVLGMVLAEVPPEQIAL